MVGLSVGSTVSSQGSNEDLEAGQRSSMSIQSGKKALGTASLVAILYFNVSGGPFGSEQAIAAGGVPLTLILFLVMPLLWSVPEAFVMAELSTLFPENSGYVTWVGAAFGPFAGYMEGFTSWTSSVLDNSIYPTIFVKYLIVSNQSLEDHEWWMTGFLTVILIFLNYRGLEVVANMTVAFAIITLAPFVLMSIFAIPSLEPSNWSKGPEGDNIEWNKLLNILFWCLNYWDTASTIAGEVDNPQKTYPIAVSWALLLVVCSYFFPLLIGTGVAPVSEETWSMGFFAKVGQITGDKLGSHSLGLFLMGFTVCGSLVSNVGQFQSELVSSSYQIDGMAADGWVPAVFGKKSRYDTPAIGIGIGGVIALVGSQLDVNDAIDMLNLPYCIAALLEFAAFLKLRWSHDELPRPYRVPLSFWGCCFALMPSSFFIAGLIVSDVYAGNVVAISFLIGVLITGTATYFLFDWMRRNNHAQFNGDPRHRNYLSGLSQRTSPLLDHNFLPPLSHKC